MIFKLLFLVVFAGFSLLLSVLHLMRALYACGICTAPQFSSTSDQLPISPAQPADIGWPEPPLSYYADVHSDTLRSGKGESQSAIGDYERLSQRW